MGELAAMAQMAAAWVVAFLVLYVGITLLLHVTGAQDWVLYRTGQVERLSGWLAVLAVAAWWWLP